MAGLHTLAPQSFFLRWPLLMEQQKVQDNKKQDTFYIIIMCNVFPSQLCSAPDDYLPLNIFLVFTPGTQHVTIPLLVFDDLVVELKLEWFGLSLETRIAPAPERILFTQPNTTVFIEDKNSEYIYFL